MTLKLFSRRFALAGLAGAAAAISAPRLPAESRMPTKMIDEFHESLLAVMRAADTLGFNGRYAHLKPSIEDSFHLPIMAQIATGSFWRKASPGQQAQLIQVFSDVSVGTYANRFSGFSGQSFQTKVTREGPQKTMLVDTVLRNPSGRDVDLTYVCRKIKGTWRIIDVLLGPGISEMAVRRSEYRRILKSDGIDGLIATLKRKARDLRSSD
tara:strand:+ start:1276 stop:1905 length:630 start_codon:yes stop_codon:yes gene_type:complete